MFHIFNRLVILNDHVCDVARSCDFIVSGFNDQVNSLAKDIAKNSNSQQVFDSYQTMLNSYGFDNDSQMFNKLFDLSGGYSRFYFFADKETYALMAIKTIKLLFANVTATAAYKVYKASLDWQYCQTLLDKNVSEVPLIDEASYRDLYLSQQDFEKLFNDTSFTGDKSELLSKIITQISSEYLIMHYQNTHIDIKDRARTLIDRLISQSVFDMGSDYLQTSIVTGLINVDKTLFDYVALKDTTKKIEYLEKFQFNSSWPFYDKYVELKQIINDTLDKKLEVFFQYMHDDPITYATITTNGSVFKFNPLLLKTISEVDISNQFVLAYDGQKD